MSDQEALFIGVGVTVALIVLNLLGFLFLPVLLSKFKKS